MTAAKGWRLGQTPIPTAVASAIFTPPARSRKAGMRKIKLHEIWNRKFLPKHRYYENQ